MLVKAAGMTPAELRSRIARSGLSGKRLARLLGILQSNVSRWCTGIRPIPAHHIPAIIRLTDNPPARTGPAWRPPGGMPVGRSKGWGSKVSRQRRAVRAERPEPLRRQPAGDVRSDRPDWPAQAAAGKRAVDRPASAPPPAIGNDRRVPGRMAGGIAGGGSDSAASSRDRQRSTPAGGADFSGLTDALRRAGRVIGGQSIGRAIGAGSAAPLRRAESGAGGLPVRQAAADASGLQRPSQTRQSGTAEPPAGAPGMPGMAGPLHADFVRRHNMAPQPMGADAIMLMRFFRRRH